MIASHSLCSFEGAGARELCYFKLGEVGMRCHCPVVSSVGNPPPSQCQAAVVAKMTELCGTDLLTAVYLLNLHTMLPAIQHSTPR